MEPDAQNAIYFFTKKDNCAGMFCIRLLKNKTSRHRRRPRGHYHPKRRGNTTTKDVGLMIIIRNLSQQQKDRSNKKETGITPHPKRGRKRGREGRHRREQGPTCEKIRSGDKPTTQRRRGLMPTLVLLSHPRQRSFMLTTRLISCSREEGVRRRPPKEERAHQYPMKGLMQFD